MAIDASLLETVPFTSRPECEALASSLGVELRIEEPPTGQVAAFISWGTSEVLYYFVNVIPPDTTRAAAVLLALSRSPWVRWKATISACLFLSGMGGEPQNETFLALWEKSEAQLQLILTGKIGVPGLVLTEDHGRAPVSGMIRIDMQRVPAVRRIPAGSTDTPAGYAPPNDVPRYPGWGWY